MKSGLGQKQETSEFEEHEPAFCIQVLRQRGRTLGHGASGAGVSVDERGEVVEEVTPPVGFLTH